MTVVSSDRKLDQHQVCTSRVSPPLGQGPFSACHPFLPSDSVGAREQAK